MRIYNKNKAIIYISTNRILLLTRMKKNAQFQLIKNQNVNTKDYY